MVMLSSKRDFRTTAPAPAFSYSTRLDTDAVLLLLPTITGDLSSSPANPVVIVPIVLRYFLQR